MNLSIDRIDDPKKLQEISYSFLCQEEAKNCLPIGIIDTLVRRPETYKKFYFWIIKKVNEVIGLAWYTPPYPLGITSLPKESFRLLMDKVRCEDLEIAGVIGPSPEVDGFVESWNADKGCFVASIMKQRIYKLETVATTPGVGRMILATSEHVDLAKQWSESFMIDCGLYDDVPRARESAIVGIRDQSRYLWLVNDKPVAMVGASGRTPSGIRISWVYTPNELRGNGYASSLVSSLSQKFIDEGLKFCFLFTDLGNPTSNSIYQRIGYKQVSDSVLYKLKRCSQVSNES